MFIQTKVGALKKRPVMAKPVHSTHITPAAKLSKPSIRLTAFMVPKNHIIKKGKKRVLNGSITVKS